MKASTAKIRLFFREMAQIADSTGLSVVVLTDEHRRQAITIICDEPMTQQLLIRLNRLPGQETMLPEVLTKMLLGMENLKTQDFELQVYAVEDGQYKTELTCLPKALSIPIRVSDAILLSQFSGIPLYIDMLLFFHQCSAYVPHTSGLVIPINTIGLDQLNEELQKAIAEENYRLASSLYEEIKKRTKQ